MPPDRQAHHGALAVPALAAEVGDEEGMVTLPGHWRLELAT